MTNASAFVAHEKRSILPNLTLTRPSPSITKTEELFRSNPPTREEFYVIMGEEMGEEKLRIFIFHNKIIFKHIKYNNIKQALIEQRLKNRFV